jgi:hypothetical protein
MMRIHARAIIALAAFAALLVVPSTASASPELGETVNGVFSKIPVGSNVIATNVAHSATVKTTKFTTPITTVECTTATLTGSVTSNSGTHIAINVTTAEFSNSGAPCTSGLGNTSVTPSHSSNPTHNGFQALPWCLTANTLNDKVTFRGGGCSEAARPLTFTLHTAVAGTCAYQSDSFTGTYTTHPADAVVTVDAGQAFVRKTGSGFCPNEGTFDMAFTLTTDLANNVEGAALSIK